jgi:signal peptidase II
MVKKLLQKPVALFSLITFLIIAFDQLTKYLIQLYQPHWNLKIFEITFIKNTGAGFGILRNQTFFLGIISLIVAVTLIVYYKRIPKEKNQQILFALFLGGVIGNLIDRFFRNYVIDFISFSFWPAFNIADSALTISVIGIVIYFWKK